MSEPELNSYHVTAGIVLGAVMGGCIGMMLGVTSERENVIQLHKEAIEHGAARWDADVNGKTTFHWNNEKPAEAKP